MTQASYDSDQHRWVPVPRRVGLAEWKLTRLRHGRGCPGVQSPQYSADGKWYCTYSSPVWLLGVAALGWDRQCLV